MMSMKGGRLRNIRGKIPLVQRKLRVTKAAKSHPNKEALESVELLKV
jgi:hypothetical protein